MFRNPVTDVVIVLVIVLLIFGPKRLPQLGRSLGQGMREFKDSITGDSKHGEDDEARPELPAASASAPPQTPAPAPVAQPAPATPPAPAEESVRAPEVGSAERRS
jgi:sec-independent protein translocase protein TatA